MKNIAIVIFIVLIIAILGLYLFSFQVRETQSVLVTTFGKPTHQITEPGWYFKWPAPIQTKHPFDSRMRVFEGDLIETETAERVPIVVNTYVVWEIAEPLGFFNAVGTVREAESKLLSQISDTQNTIIGRHSFGEFVNSDPNEIKFPQIEEEMLTHLQEAVANANYGIEIKTLGIKQLKISKDVSEKVFERMRAERNTKYQATIAQGNAEATKIKADADSKKTELLAVAEAKAKAIQAEGDAEAAKYYKMLEVDPEFAMFLREIDAAKETLKERSTIILREGSWLASLLGQMPNIEPRDPNESKE